MSATALLLLPLVAGYLFATRWYGSKFQVAREEGHRLYFNAAFFGTVCVFTGSVLHLVFIQLFPNIPALLNAYIQALNPQGQVPDGWLSSLTSIMIFTLLFGLKGGGLLNALGDRLRGDRLGWLSGGSTAPSWNQCLLRNAIQESGSQLDLIVLESVERQAQLLFTLQSNKIYVGYVLGTPDGKMPGDFRILPMLSGYRDEEHTARFTTRYVEVYDKLMEAEADSVVEAEDFSIVIPIKEIRSVAFFNPDMYTRFAAIDRRKLKDPPAN